MGGTSRSLTPRCSPPPVYGDRAFSSEASPQQPFDVGLHATHSLLAAAKALARVGSQQELQAPADPDDERRWNWGHEAGEGGDGVDPEADAPDCGLSTGVSAFELDDIAEESLQDSADDLSVRGAGCSSSLAVLSLS